MKDRIAEIIRAYDAQGIHRTATDVDLVSAQWLAEIIKEIGFKPQLPEFNLNRIDIHQAEIVVGDNKLEGVPLFDCAEYTSSEGIRGKLGDIDNQNAEIGVTVVPPWPGHEYTEKFNEARKTGKFKAMVSVTIGPSKGLFLLNANDFLKPFGPPVLQVTSRAGAWLKDATEAGAEATVVADAKRTTSTAVNVETRIKGLDPGLPPLVVITPRSGWWECASERGGGIAAWLEMMRAFKENSPDRDVIFTANTGHELHHLGMDYFLETNPDLLDRAYAWIHLGANFAASENSVHVVCADDEIKDNFIGVVSDVELNAMVGKPFGEAIPIHKNGGRFISVGGTNPWFHAREDRWPEAVNLKQTMGIVEGLIKLSKQLASR